jgi:hypothetical protein
MKRLTAVLVVGVALLWSTAAFAQYAALEEAPYMGPYAGVGGLVVSGDDGSGGNGSSFLATVNLAGLTDYLAWQAFYGMDNEEATAWGGSLDYILASNFDECFACPAPGMWWFGAGGRQRRKCRDQRHVLRPQPRFRLYLGRLDVQSLRPLPARWR